MVKPTTQFRQTLFGLVRLYADELARLRGVRRARWLAASVAVVAIVSMLAGLDGDSAVLTSLEALGWLSWLVGGVITWSALRNWSKFQEPLSDMARERGVHATWRDLAAPLALTRQLALAIGIPALLLTAFTVTLASGTRLPWAYPALLILVPVYALAFAGGLGVLVFVSTKWCSGAATIALLAMLLIPHACRELWPHTPSVIGFYEWIWSELVQLGAAS